MRILRIQYTHRLTEEMKKEVKIPRPIPQISLGRVLYSQYPQTS